ncbi:hypothetical protein [Hyphomicrobium sp.]|uniref:hypothetical protein n=1 Tax=Hyphomicrobium sp. TaxID=82 RepID=UPI002D76C51A|nr:hypothetical protein [Hyphomicrobium sp.]HET6388069.1 hypothetical protein [Hyphomicrobium sp.]
MTYFLSASAVALLAASIAPAWAQTKNIDNSLPESMRIQQRVTEQYERDGEKLRERNSRLLGPQTPSAAGGNNNSRINPAGSGPQRLQLDNNANTQARGTPGAGATNPGLPANAGSPTTGTGAGASGSTGAGMPSAGTPGVGTAGAGRGGAAGGSRGSSAGGSSGGGSSGGGS